MNSLCKEREMLRLIPELLSSIKDAIDAVEEGNLYERMCCDGQMCGCLGSTNADYLAHCLRETLAKAMAMDARSDETARLSPEGDSVAPQGDRHPDMIKAQQLCDEHNQSIVQKSIERDGDGA